MNTTRYLAITLVASILLISGCQTDTDGGGTGGGMDRETKRTYDRTAMQLERVAKERDDLRAQVDQLRKQNNDLRAQLAGRAPTTRP